MKRATWMAAMCCALGACDFGTGDIGRDGPAEAAALVAAAAPAIPTTGINPCAGWPGGLFGAAATYSHDVNTVSFHGGTWTVPLPVRVGQMLSDVAFTIEAPTGHAGDPTSVRVALYSNGNALAFATLTPAGMGTPVAGDIPLNGRVVASGEVLGLELSPLDSVAGGYAANDTKIDSVGLALPRPTLWMSAPAFQLSQSGNVSATLSNGVWTHSEAFSSAIWEAPLSVPAGSSIDSIEAFYTRADTTFPVDTYTIYLRSIPAAVGSTPTPMTVASGQNTGTTPSNFPYLDHVVATGLPVRTSSGSVYWIRMNITNPSGPVLTHPTFTGVAVGVTPTAP